MMTFSYLQEYIKLLKKQQVDRKEFMEVSFDDESAIKEWFSFEHHQLYCDAKFYHGIDMYIEDETQIIDSSNYSLSLLDEIENPTLLQALESLSEAELNILISHALNGVQLKEIAARLGKPEGTIRSIFSRVKKKIKKFF